MTRREARTIAIFILYEYSYGANAIDEILEVYSAAIDEKDMEYIKKVCLGVSQNAEELDAKIEKYSKGWKLSRISRISIAIMRVAIYEAYNLEDVSPSVAVNEAVEIVKEYDEDAPKFINGILGSILREKDDRTE